jgi:hypothetical protein
MLPCEIALTLVMQLRSNLWLRTQTERPFYTQHYFHCVR